MVNITVKITLPGGKLIAEICCAVKVTPFKNVLLEKTHRIHLEPDFLEVVSHETLKELAVEVVQQKVRSTGIRAEEEITVTTEDLIHLLTKDPHETYIVCSVKCSPSRKNISKAGYTYGNPDEFVDKIYQALEKVGAKPLFLKTIIRVEGHTIAREIMKYQLGKTGMVTGCVL